MARYGPGWSGAGLPGEILNYRANGEPFWNGLSIRPIRDPSGVVTQFVSAQMDITEEVHRRQRGTAQRETAELLLDVASRLGSATERGDVAQTIAEVLISLGCDRSAVALLDDRRTRLRMAATSGWPEDLQSAAAEYTASAHEHPELADVLAHPRQLLVTERNGSEFTRQDSPRSRIAGYLVTPVIAANPAPHGLLLSYWASSPPAEIPPLLAERLNGVAGLAAVALDNVDLIEQIRRDADEDPLTGLATRTAMQRALEQKLSSPSWSRTAVVYGDIDHFKRINDALGHPGGDELLRQLARRVRAVARSGDVIARPGGDEFIAILSDIRGDSDVETFVRRLEDALRAPFEIGGTRLYATMSIGWAAGLHAVSVSPAEVAADLLKTADTRMYEAKRRRHSGGRPPAHGGRAGLSLDTALHDAVDDGEITAYFQPQYDMRTGSISGYEALARWEHPQLGPVSPSTFIPLAEDNGLIHALGLQILDQACRFAERASLLQRHPIRMQVNVSTRELARPGFAARTLAHLDAWPDRSWLLGLEVTESALILDRPRVEDALWELRNHGVGIGIDDFGSGYSSLSQLQELPATELKVDKTFIQREGAVGTSLLRAIITLGQSLQLQVIAEGVETEEQLARLRTLDCDTVQGFLLAPALPPDAALNAPRHDAHALNRRWHSAVTGVSLEGVGPQLLLDEAGQFPEWFEVAGPHLAGLRAVDAERADAISIPGSDRMARVEADLTDQRVADEALVKLGVIDERRPVHLDRVVAEGLIPRHVEIDRLGDLGPLTVVVDDVDRSSGRTVLLARETHELIQARVPGHDAGGGCPAPAAGIVRRRAAAAGLLLRG